MEGELQIEQQLRLAWWPSPQDYNEAVQTPGLSYDDLELQQTEPELNGIGIPKANTGNFASVYHVYGGGHEWAVRCFLRNVFGQRERYKHIEIAINESRAPFLVSFQYVERGIKVHADWFPILKMQWVDGIPLIDYLIANRHRTDVLEKTAEEFRTMVLEMQTRGIAHGDLQHGNIIVTSDGLKLVDYDGMFVPGLSGETASELGHRNYQHPKRQPHHFDQSVDNFSAWLIYSSIICLSEDPSLFDRLDVGDECLLFKQADLKRPSISMAFDALENHANPIIRKHVRWIRVLLQQPVEQVPRLHEEIDETIIPLPPQNSGLTHDDTKRAWLVAVCFFIFLGLIGWWSWSVTISSKETEATVASSPRANPDSTLQEATEASSLNANPDYITHVRQSANVEADKCLARVSELRKPIANANQDLMLAIQSYSVHPQSQHVKLSECWHSLGHNFEQLGVWSKAAHAYDKGAWYLYRYGDPSDDLWMRLKQDYWRMKRYEERDKAQPR